MCRSSLIHGGFDDESAPWGTSRLGKVGRRLSDINAKGAALGGAFNNFRIPFQKSINITVQQPITEAPGDVWFVVRGLEGASVSVGELVLPPHGICL